MGRSSVGVFPLCLCDSSSVQSPPPAPGSPLSTLGSESGQTLGPRVSEETPGARKSRRTQRPRACAGLGLASRRREGWEAKPGHHEARPSEQPALGPPRSSWRALSSQHALQSRAEQPSSRGTLVPGNPRPGEPAPQGPALLRASRGRDPALLEPTGPEGQRCQGQCWVHSRGHQPQPSVLPSGPCLTRARNILAVTSARARWAKAAAPTLGPHSHVSSREARSSVSGAEGRVSPGTELWKQAEGSREEAAGAAQRDASQQRFERTWQTRERRHAACTPHTRRGVCDAACTPKKAPHTPLPHEITRVCTAALVTPGAGGRRRGAGMGGRGDGWRALYRSRSDFLNLSSARQVCCQTLPRPCGLMTLFPEDTEAQKGWVTPLRV